MKRIFLLLFLFAATTSFSQKHEGLALTPPMDGTVGTLLPAM